MDNVMTQKCHRYELNITVNTRRTVQAWHYSSRKGSTEYLPLEVLSTLFRNSFVSTRRREIANSEGVRAAARGLGSACRSTAPPECGKKTVPRRPRGRKRPGAKVEFSRLIADLESQTSWIGAVSGRAAKLAHPGRLSYSVYPFFRSDPSAGSLQNKYSF